MAELPTISATDLRKDIESQDISQEKDVDSK